MHVWRNNDHITYGDYAEIISLLTSIKSVLRSAPWPQVYCFVIFLSLWNSELNNAKKSCFKPFDWTIWSHSQPRSEQKTTKKTHISSTTSKLLQQRTNNFKAIVSNNEQRAQLFQYLETFRRVWQKPIECYVTCHSVHFSLWSNWTGCPQQHDNIGKVDQCKLRKAL